MATMHADNNTKEKSEVILLKDSQWRLIEEELCRVADFHPFPLNSVKNGKVLSLDKTLPYASIHLECKKLPEEITGFITHKIDFIHLWMAFKEIIIKEDEEVLIIWTRKRYKNVVYKISSTIYSPLLPKLFVMICPKGAFELWNYPIYKPELMGEARWNASKPIVELKPECME